MTEEGHFEQCLINNDKKFQTLNMF